MKKVILALTLSLASSCSLFRGKSDYLATEEYRNKPVYQKSILEDSEINLADAQKILNSRIQYPKKMNLAVIRLNSNVDNRSYYWTHNSNIEKNKIDDSFVTNFYKKLEANKNIQSVIPVPPSLIPNNPNINRLRSLGLRMQAHLILVINANTELQSNNIFQQDHKSETIAESYLIDTATGIIVSTGTYIDDALDKSISTDMSTEDALQRAKLESEKKVFANIANDVSNFLTKVL